MCTPIVALSLSKSYWAGTLFDYMVNASWVGKPEIILVALFQGRNLCDLVVGVNSSMIVAHHLIGIYSIFMVSTMKPYRDQYLGIHCTYLIFMEFGSILYNFYVLWPSIRHRNLFFVCMSTTNMMGIFWHWIAGSVGNHQALLDPKVFVTCIVGSVLSYFRQKEVFVVCGCPIWLGGKGLRSPESAISYFAVKESSALPINRKKCSRKYAVESGQKNIPAERNMND